jgi:cell division septation protein DedD
LSAYSRDDDFREIQLNGKQLVFLFMVGTVFSVVVFLCGVFVGRGVRAERAPLVADAGNPTPVTPDIVPAQETTPPPAGSDPTAAAPPPAVDELSYFNRLDKTTSSTEDLKPASPQPKATQTKPSVEAKASAAEPKPASSQADAAPPSAGKPAPAGSDPRAAKETKPANDSRPVSDQKAAKDAKSVKGSPEDSQEAAVAAEPSGPGFALQITALREKGEAETIARRLASKGYSAYVLTPAKGAPAMFRVRIGKFKTRREAEAMATRLQKEEQFTPWITR